MTISSDHRRWKYVAVVQAGQDHAQPVLEEQLGIARAGAP